MEPLAKLVVSFLELAESELATLKRGIVRLGLSLVFVLAAGVTGLVGVVLLLAAGFLLLQSLLNTTAALAISGALFLAITAVLGLSAFHRASRQTPSAAAVTDEAVRTTPDDHGSTSTIRIAS